MHGAAHVAHNLIRDAAIDQEVQEARHCQADVVGRGSQHGGEDHDGAAQHAREAFTGIQLGMTTVEAARQPSRLRSAVQVQVVLSLSFWVAVPAAQSERAVGLQEDQTLGIGRVRQTQFNPSDGCELLCHRGMP